MPSTTAGGLPIPLDSDPVADAALAMRNLAAAFDTNTGWTAVTVFGGTWVNYNAAGGTYQVLQYKRVGDTIKVRGTVKNGTSGTTVFTLPAGYRPPANQIFACAGGGAFGQAEVNATTGTVTYTGSNLSAHLNFQFERA